MLTTAGPTCLAILTKSLGGTVELTTLRGVASALVVLLLLSADAVGGKGTATMAAERVASKIKAEARRRERSRSKSDFMDSMTS